MEGRQNLRDSIEDSHIGAMYDRDEEPKFEV